MRMKNKTRISRLRTILVKEQCQEERKALHEQYKDSKAGKLNNDPYFKYLEDTYPRGGFSYTPTDWVRRQEIFNAEPVSLEEANHYLNTHKADLWVKQWLKVLGVMAFLCLLNWGVI